LKNPINWAGLLMLTYLMNMENLLVQEKVKNVSSVKIDYNELRKHIFKLLEEFQNTSELELLENTLTEFANRSLLYEISLSPKPGLVNYYNSGAHEDMNFYTFLNSASALAPYWRKFVEAGSNFEGKPHEVLPIIRQIGLQAETAMFKSTLNVNTHKGIIFLMGLSVFSKQFHK